MLMSLRLHVVYSVGLLPDSHVRQLRTPFPASSLPLEFLGGFCMFRVIGVDHKQGVFEGKGYDNYNFHCLSDESSSVLRGFTCEIIKMKVADVSVIFGMPMSRDDVCALVGSYISPLYDRFKRVIRCEIVDPPENCALSAVALP